MKNDISISYASPHALASLPQSTPVLVAFSGGADSSALLHILKNDSIMHGYELHAAHFHHGIRGEEADRDANFCRSTCEKLGIPFHLGYADIPSLAQENGNSIEAEARERRYAFFEKIMCENNIPILVTAHHAEDQIESIMLHILRGSGISGLRGIAECRMLESGYYLVRPLLKTNKVDIFSYCAKNKIDYVTDTTNEDTDYTRNFIRAELTPIMFDLQPNLQGVFARLGESATEANDFIECYAKEFMQNECNEGIPLLKFNKLHAALKSRVLMLMCNSSLGYTHIQSLIALCQKAEPHSSLSLPNNISAVIENEMLVFVKKSKENCDMTFDIPFTPGKTILPNGVIINVEKNPPKNIPQNDIFLDVKCDIIKGDARFRQKRDGDIIFSGNMNKKVKKLLNERKIPLDMRKKLPILVVENEILWIPLVQVCDRIKKDKIIEDDNYFRITVKFEN